MAELILQKGTESLKRIVEDKEFTLEDQFMSHFAQLSKKWTKQALFANSLKVFEASSSKSQKPIAGLVLFEII